MSEINFEGLALDLLNDIRDLLSRWLPGGKVIGHEYVCADFGGGPGKDGKGSLSININTGRWSDFSTGAKGGDLISLYAAIQGIKNSQAARALLDSMGKQLSDDKSIAISRPAPAPEKIVAAPPAGTPFPNLEHYQFGKPSSVWVYRGPLGETLYYVARYENEGSKEIVPWAWCPEDKKFIGKSFKKSERPLYGLDRLYTKQTAQVVVVEGEKSAEAAREIFASLGVVVVTWSNGSNSWHLTDWSPLTGRRLLLWPDSDRKIVKSAHKEFLKQGLKVGDTLPADQQPGLKTMLSIASLLAGKCPEIKLIRVPIDNEKKDGWDAADALKEGWTCDDVVAWAKPFTEVFKPAVEIIPKPKPTPATQVPAAPEDEEEKNEDFSSPGSLHEVWEKIGIGLTKNGSPICNYDNAMRILERWAELKDIAWFDEFHQRVFTSWGSKTQREWTDIDDLRLLGFFQRELGFTRMSVETIRQAIMAYAGEKHRIRNEPKDWMNTLVWDHTNRLEKFFHTCYGTEDNEYYDGISKNWWIGMVSRIFQPGSKVDNMVILEGPQGAFKSTSLKIIGGNWYVDTDIDPSEKDFYMILQGKLIIEISEFAAFLRADPAAVKAAVTRQTDRFRPPYGHRPVDFPRQCVFVGSINEEIYLGDPTGARRYYPAKTGVIDLDRLREIRDQLFAEAVYKFKKGESWYAKPVGAEAMQDERRQVDHWEESVSAALADVENEEFTLLQIANRAFSRTAYEFKRADTARLGAVLRKIGWAKRYTTISKKASVIYYKPKTE